MHELERYAVCPAPARVRRVARGSCFASAFAQEYGVAGSPVEPMTRIGGAPGAFAAAGCLCGPAGQYAQGRVPHATAAPKSGADFARRAASALYARIVVGAGRSRQLVAMFPERMLENDPSAFAPA